MRLFLSLILVLMATPSIVMAQTSATAAATNAPASVSPQKRALIIQFFDASGSRASMQENLNKMFAQVSPEHAQEAAKLRDKIKVDEIIDQLIPVYDSTFTAEDLQGLIDFYTSPLGKNLIQKLPGLMQETIAITNRYMQDKIAATLPKGQS